MDNLKYAVIERERRWKLSKVPEGLVGETFRIRDKYLSGTRMRLREMTAGDGVVVRKLGHKVRPSAGPEAIACTSLYLDDAEWDRLAALPGHTLGKRRTRVRRAGVVLVVDEFEGPLEGLVLAEIDSGSGPSESLPEDWAAGVEVTADERYTGGALAVVRP